MNKIVYENAKASLIQKFEFRTTKVLNNRKNSKKKNSENFDFPNPIKF